MSDSAELEAAALRARDARATLEATVHELRVRLRPERVRDELVARARGRATEIASTVVNAARREPRAAAFAGAAGIALLLRRPLWRLFRRTTRRRRETD